MKNVHKYPSYRAPSYQGKESVKPIDTYDHMPMKMITPGLTNSATPNPVGFRNSKDGYTSNQCLDTKWPRVRGNADVGVGKTKG